MSAQPSVQLDNNPSNLARYAALVAALLGWLFDGFEMGLFPVISRPALVDLLGYGGKVMSAEQEGRVGAFNGIIIAAFLVGAATGGVLFGWLGDKLGRVRAMSLSILTYAGVSGLGAFVGLTGFESVFPGAWQMVAVRFVAALGMGGEWALGVALVMEIWGERSRALLAGLIGAAANVGYVLVALLSLGIGQLRESLVGFNLSSDWIEWRLLMLMGVLPAGLTFVIRLFVPESHRWEAERASGSTTAWSGVDLVGVLVGAGAGLGILAVWADNGWANSLRLVATLPLLAIVVAGYLYPVFAFERRLGLRGESFNRSAIPRMVLGACLSGVPLLGTWASVQWAPTWASELTKDAKKAMEAGEAGPDLPVAVVNEAKAYTQMASALGASLGAMVGAWLGMASGRKWAYVVLCIGSLGAVQMFFRTNAGLSWWFFGSAFVMGAVSASFYGWLPLYLPELFATRQRATGQGFSFNFGRVLAAVGALQTGALMKGYFQGDYAKACSIMALVYLVGLVVIVFAPETKDKALPD